MVGPRWYSGYGKRMLCFKDLELSFPFGLLWMKANGIFMLF